MSVTVRRYKKSTYDFNKKLPDQLKFLKGINFFVIAEHKKGKDKQLFVEFRPRSIKNIISKANKVNDLRKKISELEEKNEDLKMEMRRLKELEDALKFLSADYRFVLKDKNKEIPAGYKSPINSVNLMEKYGYVLHGPPMQGGSPR